MAGATGSLLPCTGTKVSPCELRHMARTGSERFLNTACEDTAREHWQTARQKRSGSISAWEGAGKSGEYAQSCCVSISPVAAKTTALHLLDPISMASKLMVWIPAWRYRKVVDLSARYPAMFTEIYPPLL